jgi:hypothetical protein
MPEIADADARSHLSCCRAHKVFDPVEKPADALRRSPDEEV